jgi:hypothetical protein
MICRIGQGSRAKCECKCFAFLFVAPGSVKAEQENAPASWGDRREAASRTIGEERDRSAQNLAGTLQKNWGERPGETLDSQAMRDVQKVEEESRTKGGGRDSGQQADEFLRTEGFGEEGHVQLHYVPGSLAAPGWFGWRGVSPVHAHHIDPL